MTQNLELLRRVATRLEPLLTDLVFVGGAVIELYVSTPVTDAIRPTQDADVVCEVTGTGAYREVCSRIEALGFSQSATHADPPFRWRCEGDLLDVLPTDGSVLGFENRWFGPGAAVAVRHRLAADLEIRLLPAPYLLASKLEAYADRGRDDPYGSDDFEDIVVLLASRPEIVEETAAAPKELRDWLAERLDAAFPRERAIEFVASHLQLTTNPGLDDLLLERIERLRSDASGDSPPHPPM